MIVVCVILGRLFDMSAELSQMAETCGLWP